MPEQATVTERAQVTQHYGKYRGTVIDNVDPLQIGRILVQVSDASNILPSTWAMPCVPFAGIQSGFFVVPPIGSGVWVEFEQGNTDYPIWTGGYWSSTEEVPALVLAAPPGEQPIVIQTLLENTLMISDVPGPTGGILLKNNTGALISISDTGIIITNGEASIVLEGPTVTINEGALAVV